MSNSPSFTPPATRFEPASPRFDGLDVFPPVAARRRTIFPFFRSLALVWRRTMGLMSPREPQTVKSVMFRPINPIPLLRWIAACAVLAAPIAAHAQPFPSKPIRIVVPYAAGGAVDVIARLVGQKMAETLGQPVVVENRPGAAATIGTNMVARAAPDGYTLLMTTNPHTVNPSLNPRLPYDPIKDFQPLTLAGITPIFVVVHPSVPASSVKDLVALLKANPDKYSYGSSGNGSPQQLAGEMFKAPTGTKILHIPYKGAAPAATALLAGEVQIAFASPANVMEQVKAGRLKAFAVTTAARSRFAPKVPTMMELGFADFDIAAWLGLLAPAGTPRDIVARLHDSAVKGLAAADVGEKLGAQGIDAVTNTPEQFATLL